MQQNTEQKAYKNQQSNKQESQPKPQPQTSFEPKLQSQEQQKQEAQKGPIKIQQKQDKQENQVPSPPPNTSLDTGQFEEKLNASGFFWKVRYTLLSKSQWYKQTKPELLKKNPNISLPFLIDGNEVICESEAIMTHICYRENRLDLLGRNGKEKVKMATALGIFHKMQYDFEQLCYGFYDQQNKSFEYARDEFEQQKFRPKIKMLIQIIQNNDFFCGMDNITYVDFIIADFLEILFFLCSRLRDDNIILNYYQRQFWKMPQLAAYVKSGRFFRRPYNEPQAVWR